MVVINGLVYFLQGFIFGLAIAAPVGPIALLCIKRTLLHGLYIGIATGIGAALADTLYGTIAVFSISTIIDFITGHHNEFKLFGGSLLIFLSYKSYVSDPHEIHKTPDSKSTANAFITGLLLTLTNPLTLVAFLTSFAAFGIGSGFRRVDDLTFILGILAGASSWWLFLNSLVLIFRSKISAVMISRVNKGAAIVLFSIAMYAVVTGTIDLVEFYSQPS